MSEILKSYPAGTGIVLMIIPLIGIILIFRKDAISRSAQRQLRLETEASRDMQFFHRAVREAGIKFKEISTEPGVPWQEGSVTGKTGLSRTLTMLG